MAATKASMIYAALLAVNGGEVTDTMGKTYGDAEEFFAYAFNYVQLGSYWAENKAEMEHTINPLVLTPFDNIPISYSTTRQMYFATLPAPIVPIVKGRALEISTESGKRLIPMTQGEDSLYEHTWKYFKDVKYQVEGNQTVWFYGLGQNMPLLQFIRPKYIVQVADLPDDAPILLSADGYKMVTDLMVSFLRGERQSPKNYKEDGKDNI